MMKFIHAMRESGAMSLRPRSSAEREFDSLLGREIMRLRLARGMSGAFLARTVDVAQQQISWIESGGRCSCFLVVRIAAALEVDVAALLGKSSLTSLSCYLKKSPARVIQL